MSLVSSIYNNIESVFVFVSALIQQGALSYCDLETADSEHVLVSKNGELISIIRLHGYKRFVGANEFAFLCERFREALQPVFSGRGHFLQFLFTHDKVNVAESIDKTLASARRAAERVGLSIEDIFQSRVDTLSKFCADEDCFLVLWTTPDCIDKVRLRQINKARKESLKQATLPKLSKNAQNLLLVLPEIRNIHESFMGTIFEDLQYTGFYVDILNVHDAVYEIRKTVDVGFTDDNWRPYLPGDKLPLKFDPKEKADLGDLMWPTLDQQIIPRDAENIDLKTARIGDTIYAPIYIELFPKDIRPFYELFRRMLPSNLPWRISYFVGPEGIKITQSKNIFAQFLTFSSHHNKLIVDTHKMLKNMHERSDDPIVSIYICLTTWANYDQADLLRARASKLAKVVQSWGGCEIRDVSGDAFGTTLSSALAVTKNIIATASAAPLSEVVYMMPFVRPASPWQQGALLFRTPDGKLWPYQPGSSHQVSWIDIVYARSGSGKSVLLSTINLGLCLSPGLSALPRISIIDIGPSSQGFISLLKEGLPEDRRHEVVYYRLTLEDKDSINPFDTTLGARYPTRNHRSFLLNFISLLLVDSIEDRLIEGMASMLSMLVDETYKKFSDTEQPKPYIKNSNKHIDALLEKIKFKAPSKRVTWWQVTDALFENGYVKDALTAQRYAMPTIADTISVAHTYSIKDLFSGVKTPTGEDYVSYYCRVISGVIRNYPTLTSVTKLSLEGARVIALDLDEVAKSGSSSADKQTAIMYLLARHIVAQHFFLRIDEIERFPALYHEHHKGIIKEIMEEPKRIVFDEFHRTAKSPAIRDQILQDMREGRKWKIHIALSSQSLKDFDELMIEFATSIFILDSGSAIAVEQTCKTFGLTDTEKIALSTRVHGPTSKGATFIAQFITKKGMNTQLLTSTISPVELWAFTTTTEDVYIRNFLYEEIGPIPARRFLAQRFPSGSAADDIAYELKNDPEATVSKVSDSIIKTIIKAFRRDRRTIIND